MIVSAAGLNIAFKVMVNKLPRMKALLLMYFIAAMLGVLYWASFDRTSPSLEVILIGGGLAFLNYIGVQCLWVAFKINMSKTALLMPLTSVVGAVLLCIFLQEHKHLTVLAVAGFMLHLVAIWLFGIAKSKKDSLVGRSKYKRWLFFTLLMVVVNGLIYFLMKMACDKVPKTQFVMIWYVAMFLYFFITILVKKKEEAPQLSRLVFLAVPATSIFLVMNLVFTYWAFQLNTGVTTVSFAALSSTFVPVIIGWVFFGEGSHISKLEGSGFCCAIVAAVLIIFGL